MRLDFLVNCPIRGYLFKFYLNWLSSRDFYLILQKINHNLMAQTTFITCQHVCIHQTAATILQRIIAFGFDCLILFFMVSLIEIILNRSSFLYGQHTLYDILFYATLALFLSYPLWTEYFFNGQTLGKKIMKIRVVCLDGSRPPFRAFMLRWTLLLVEIPTGLGIVFAIFNKNSQRIGDIAAGTAVVRVSSYDVPQILQNMSFAMKGYNPTYPEASNLSVRQMEVMRRVLFEYDGSEREEYLQKLATKLEDMLGIKAKDGNSERFVSTLFNDFNYYATKVV